MKKLVVNSVIAIGMLFFIVLAVGLGVESVWVWVNHVGPAVWWWCAPLGIVESFSLLALVGYGSIIWVCGQIDNK